MESGPSISEKFHGISINTAELHGISIIPPKFHGMFINPAEFHEISTIPPKFHRIFIIPAEFHKNSLTPKELDWNITGIMEFPWKLQGNYFPGNLSTWDASSTSVTKKNAVIRTFLKN